MDEEKLKALTARRGGKLSVCTRRMNESKGLFDAGSSVVMIIESLAALKTAMDDFADAHGNAQALMSDEEKDKDHAEWYEPKMTVFEDYIKRVEDWTRYALKPQRGTVEIAPEDSVSKAGSKASSVSSLRAQAAAERAALAAKAAGLQQKHALELEKAQIQSKMEMIELQTDIAAADAKLHALESYDSSVQLQSTGDFVTQSQGDGMNEYLQGYVENAVSVSEPSPVQYTQLGAVPKTPLQRMMEEKPTYPKPRMHMLKARPALHAQTTATINVGRPTINSHVPPYDPQPGQQPPNTQHDLAHCKPERSK